MCEETNNKVKKGSSTTFSFPEEKQVVSSEIKSENKNPHRNIFSIESILSNKSSEAEYNSTEEYEDEANDEVDVDCISSDRDDEEGDSLDMESHDQGNDSIDTDQQYLNNHCYQTNPHNPLVLLDNNNIGGNEDSLAHVVKPFPIYSSFPNVQPLIHPSSASQCNRKWNYLNNSLIRCVKI